MIQVAVLLIVLNFALLVVASWQIHQTRREIRNLIQTERRVLRALNESDGSRPPLKLVR